MRVANAGAREPAKVDEKHIVITNQGIAFYSPTVGSREERKMPETKKKSDQKDDKKDDKKQAGGAGSNQKNAKSSSGAASKDAQKSGAKSR